MATFKDKLTAVRELGLRKLSLLALYRFGLSSGHLKRVTSYPMPFSPDIKLLTTDLFYPPQPDFYTHHDISHSDALAEADDLCRGVVRLFGDDPTLLNLVPGGALAHWSDYELNHASWGDEDIKLIWSQLVFPGRLNWCVLMQSVKMKLTPMLFGQRSTLFSLPTRLSWVLIGCLLKKRLFAL